MNILIFTSASHIYANVLLNSLIARGSFIGHNVLVLEQHGIVPGKNSLSGFQKYVVCAGWAYVLPQMIKQYYFLGIRMLTWALNRTTSVFYPYYRHQGERVIREKCLCLKSDAAYQRIRLFQPDIILSLFSKYIIPKNIFTLAPNGCVNLHPAFLPNCRGVSPTFWCLANGGKYTGTTLHVVDSGIDTGAIISQEKFSTAGFVTEHGLYMKATRVGAKLVSDFIRELQNIPVSKMRLIKNPKKGSYFSLPTKESVNRFRALGYSFFHFREFITP